MFFLIIVYQKSMIRVKLCLSLIYEYADQEQFYRL